MRYDVYLHYIGREVAGQRIDWLQLGVIHQDDAIKPGDCLLITEEIQSNIAKEYPALNHPFYKVDKLLDIPEDENLKVVIVEPLNH